MISRSFVRAIWIGVAAVLLQLPGLGLSSMATGASDPAPESLDCEQLDCASVLEAAARFERVEDAPYWQGLDADGRVVGWVTLSTDLVDVRAYSGKPLVTLVGLDETGRITGARVIHHSEPILLTGIPESALYEFVAFYVGQRATDRIVVGRTTRSDTISVDAISGATVTALAQNDTIMETARNLGVEVGVIDLASVRPGQFVSSSETWDFEEMLDRGALGHLVVTEEEMGSENREGVFIELYFTIADAPQVGRSLMGRYEYEHAKSKLAPGEHLIVVLGRGRESFKGSAFVRGGVFDRVRIRQGLREITFRDTDYSGLSEIADPNAPDFDEGAVFVARGGRLDPGAPYEFVFLGSRYDRRGAFTREYHEFSASHRLPSSVYQTEGGLSRPIWLQAWYNRIFDVVGLTLFLGFVTAIFVMRKVTTANPGRLARLHLASMTVAFLYLGVYMGAQPSVTQALTFLESVRGEWRMGLFLSEPLIFTLWIFITGVSLFWGRGVFCGWVCPYGAMSELAFKVSKAFGFEGYELPEAVHSRLRHLRYVVGGLLIAVFLWSTTLGEKLAEVEPFKSTFLVPFWTREWGYASWWLLLLGLSFVMYRPFCRYLCPLGGYLAILGSFRPSGPRRRKFCSSCKICTAGCEPRAIRPDGTIDPRECLSCMECESNYRNPKICPPLVVLPRLEALDHPTPSQQKKLALYREGLEDVR